MMVGRKWKYLAPCARLRLALSRIACRNGANIGAPV